MLLILKKTVIDEKIRVIGGGAFNPDFDGNLLAWYDGDTLATDPANTWSDRSTNGFDLTLFNAPTLISPAINGHDALRFDGVNQYAERLLTPVLNFPISIYCVFKQIVWSGTVTYIGTAVGGMALFQNAAAPDLRLYNGVVSNVVAPVLNVNTYGIITSIFNDINSEIRNNNNVAVNVLSGNLNDTGFRLSSNFALLTFQNNEFAYIIIRQGADNTATQNLFINYLKNRFAL